MTCTLALSFWGYDTGTDTAQVSFTAQPPSGKFTPVPVVSGPTNFTFTVAKRTGGGQLDTSEVYQLDVSGLKAQPKQGYHIRVMADVSGSRGADEKYKVFWYEPCSPTSGGSSGGSGGSGGSSGGSGGSSGGGTSGGSSGGGSTVGLGASSGGGLSLSSSQLSSASHATGSAAGSSAGTQVVSSTSSSGSAPSGAGTDLGWFSPARWGLPLAAFWSIVAGLLALMGSLATWGTSRLRARRSA